MRKNQDEAAHERQRKVREWISAQRELQFTAKEAAAAIFGEGYTKAEQHYVSSVLSKHSMDADGPVLLVGKKHRTGTGGRSDFVYQTIAELPKPRAAFFASKRGNIKGKTSTMRKVNFIEGAPQPTIQGDLPRVLLHQPESKPFPKDLAEAFGASPDYLDMKFNEAATIPEPVKPSTTERLLDIAIHNDRGENILPMLLRLAADIAEKGDQK